jgi:hypothetical protein
MNVQQLIEELQKHPPEMRVIVKGYEGGYDDLDSPEQRSIRLNVHSPENWYFGRHEDEDYTPSSNDDIIETALLVAHA